MSDMEANFCILLIPAEVLLSIFRYLSPKDLAKCRIICSRWKQIIDDVFLSEKYWYQCCQSDYASIYQTVKYKSLPGTTWRNIYRSLFLWSKFATASETVDEFASASSPEEEISDFKVLKGGFIAVRTQNGLKYYDLQTLKQTIVKQPLKESFTSIMENDSYCIFIDTEDKLTVIFKNVSEGRIAEISFDDVCVFLLHNTYLYFATTNCDLFLCNLCSKDLQASLLYHFDESIINLGYNDTLNVLTSQNEIYSLVNKKFKLTFFLNSVSNVQHTLWRHNLLKNNLDWRTYTSWSYLLNHRMEEMSLPNILIIHPYGDVFFVGTMWGVLRIYYKPFVNGELSLCKSEPVKQYNFTERSDCPVLSRSPVFQIDVVEVEDGHLVLVGMPKKIAALYYKHVYKQSPTWPVLPFNEVNEVKIFDVD